MDDCLIPAGHRQTQATCKFRIRYTTTMIGDEDTGIDTETVDWISDPTGQLVSLRACPPPHHDYQLQLSLLTPSLQTRATPICCHSIVPFSLSDDNSSFSFDFNFNSNNFNYFSSNNSIISQPIVDLVDLDFLTLRLHLITLLDMQNATMPFCPHQAVIGTALIPISIPFQFRLH